MSELDQAVQYVFAGRINTQDIIEAFSIDHHRDGLHYISRCKLSVGQENSIIVNGKFYKVNGEEEDVGWFLRRLYRQGSDIRAYHRTIKISNPQNRLKGIGKEHYRKALQMYVNAGVANIHMEADEDGPSLWPGFGFEVTDWRQRDRLLEIVTQELSKYEITLIELTGPLTPSLAAIAVEAPDDQGEREWVALGEAALRQLYREVGEPLLMTWWLHQPYTQEYLEELGVIMP